MASERLLLIIEDDAAFARTLGRSFERRDYTVLLAANQDEAAALLEQHNPGYAVVDQTSVMATHLAEVVKQHAYELLTRQESKRLLDRLAESHPKLVEELVPKILSLGEVQKTLQQLLREQVSIRDLGHLRFYRAQY